MDVPRHHRDLRCDDGGSPRLAAAALGRGRLRVLTRVAKPLTYCWCRATPSCARWIAAYRELGATGLPPAAPSPRTSDSGEIRFGTGTAGTALLGGGWSSPSLGVWSDGDHAVLRAERPPRLTGPLRPDFDPLGFAPADDATQQVEI